MPTMYLSALSCKLRRLHGCGFRSSRKGKLSWILSISVYHFPSYSKLEAWQAVMLCVAFMPSCLDTRLGRMEACPCMVKRHFRHRVLT